MLCCALGILSHDESAARSSAESMTARPGERGRLRSNFTQACVEPAILAVRIAVLLCLSVLSVCAATKDPILIVSPALQWPANLNEYFAGEPSAWNVADEHRWRKLWVDDLNRKPPPAPDFMRGTVVVVSGGPRPTGGYRLEAVRAVKEGDAWIVEFVVHKPAPDRFVTQALTCPVTVVFFPRKDIFRPLVREVTALDAPVP